MSLDRRIDESTDEASLAQLVAIGEAFNAHDVDAIMSHFAEDGIFDNARGPDIHGKRYVGKRVLDAFFRELMASHPDIQWLSIDNRVSGDKGYAEWRRQCRLPNGEKQDWLGLDIFTFRAGKVVKKDTYFKIVE
jgi:taurine dehydrogenase small subunit